MNQEEHYHVFFSHSHDDREWVEALAARLEDERGLRVWLDRWILVPGQSWQQGLAKGLEQADSCAAFLGEKTPKGWFQQEVEKALTIQAQNSDFRVIPVLMPNAPPDVADLMPPFLDLRTWVDFREGGDAEYALHVLVQGVKGEPIGRWPPAATAPGTEEGTNYSMAERKLKELRRLAAAGQLPDTVIIEFQQKILSRWLEE